MGHDQQNRPATKPDGDRFGPEESAGNGHPHGYAALALGALGVVYGDIGTSPLYALRETILAATGAAAVGHGAGGEMALAAPVPREIVIGVLSLILWSLVIVVTLKYVVLLLRAKAAR
jgi:KUP system potassium uptake protein